MAVPELQRFREKFPQYNDIGDAELADKLAAKYSAYSDLPGKVASEAQPVEQVPNIGEILGNIRPAPFGPPIKEYPVIAANAFNAAGAGIPGELYKRMTGNQIPQPQTLPGKFVNFVGEGAGLSTGLPGAIAKVAGLGVAGLKAAPWVVRAAEGAGLGATANIPNTIRNPQQGAINAGLGAAGNVVIPPIIGKIGAVFSKKPRTLADIRTLPEKQIAKLPPEERQAYMASRNLEDQQIIAAERQTIAKKYQEVINKVRQDQKTLGRAAPAVAHERLKGLAAPFDKLRTAQNTAYRNGINEALAAAPEGDIFFTKDQINEAIANKYLQPQFPGQPPVLQEDPTEYRQLIDLMDNHPLVNKNEISTRDILNMADSEYSMSPAAKSGLKSPIPSQTQAAHLRDILLDLLESRGMPVRAVKADWKEWVPIRNLGFKLQSPSGPSQIIRIVKGLDPVHGEQLDQLEALLGQPLRSEVKGIFNQLDALKQQKVIEGAKKLEAQRLLQNKIGFMKGSRIEQKLRIDQMAAHSENVNQLIFAVVKGAATAVGAGGIVGSGYLIKKALD